MYSEFRTDTLGDNYTNDTEDASNQDKKKTKYLKLWFVQGKKNNWKANKYEQEKNFKKIIPKITAWFNACRDIKELGKDK